MLFEGKVRRFVKTALGANPDAVRMTYLESLAVAQTEDELYELGRGGRRFMGGNSIIANGIAPVAAIPTVTATLALANPGSSGRNLVINKLNLWLGSGTAAAGLTLFVTSAIPVAASFPAGPGSATGYAVGNCNPGSALVSKAFWATAVTLPATAVWIAVLSSFQAAAANVGQGDVWSDERGGIIVPPGGVLGLGILSGAGTTPLYGVSARWSEKESSENE